MNFGHIKNIHFVGIGGIGMSGIAEILTNYDLSISGCDMRASETTDKLSKEGIEILIGHDASHAEQADLMVISSAVKADTPELIRARALHVPVIRRAEMLGEIMRLKRGIAVAGTHGKTTTSAMIAMVLSEGGLDPTLIIGGVLRDLATNARLGKSDYLVVEADEYDRSFLTLHPTCAVVTNIEADHLDCYKDLADIRNTFAAFARKVPFYGCLIGCADDPLVLSLLDSAAKRSVRYGFSEEAELRATNISFENGRSAYDVSLDGQRLGRVSLAVPGNHNIRNSLAAIAVALELDVPFESAALALSKFGGVERRFQIVGQFRGAIIVDDYAHHPTEIRATLQAARSGYPDRRIVALFQPHLYSRTRDFVNDFADSLRGADVALVSKIYGAREEPIEGVNSSMITSAANEQGARNVSLIEGNNAEIEIAIRSMLSPDDLFVTMGAGDINGIGRALAGATS
ncbi:MAG TPA: UDP-N-acetylmuramate--L-alanine ligase [Thermoanaerobaculia bacterium]|nr:UDP-N-acetylmuramate--L-alanine ligase [Thermoanaerobaculia bacterium]